VNGEVPVLVGLRFSVRTPSRVPCIGHLRPHVCAGDRLLRLRDRSLHAGSKRAEPPLLEFLFAAYCAPPSFSLTEVEEMVFELRRNTGAELANWLRRHYQVEQGRTRHRPGRTV